VDFVVRKHGTTSLVQVCASLANADTRGRELRALAQAFRETDARRAAIVTLNEEGSLRVGRRKVHVVPAWRWLIDRNVI
jgi:predicted AAA+ superfamily ATPase